MWRTISDLSAALTGLLLALCLPAAVPLYVPPIGAVLAIWLGKQIYGGLGNNPFNPALVARVGLLIEGDPVRECFPKQWLDPAVQLEFEGHFFPAPVGYKPHMELFYGPHVTKEEHYHNLPQYPAVHNHEVFWKE